MGSLPGAFLCTGVGKHTLTLMHITHTHAHTHRHLPLKVVFTNITSHFKYLP